MTTPGAPGELSLLDLIILLRARWRLVLGLPFAAAVVMAAATFLMSPKFSASTSFVPETARGPRLPSNLAGLAGQFGLSVGADASRSPRFYVEVLKSRELLEKALLAAYPVTRSSGDSMRLLDLLDVRGRDGADSLDNGLRKLNKSISTRVDMQTSVVRLTVTSRDPSLAARVANRMVGYLNEFNTQTRQSQARERRRFVEQRLTEAETELRVAEGDLRAFYERNRTWQQAPQLMFEEGRLRRQVEIRQEVYLTLKREFETARIEEVNDTPVITVIDPAIPPQRRSSPQRKMLVLLAIISGGIAAVFWVFGATYFASLRLEPGGNAT